MTIKNRKKKCLNCKNEFSESKSDSDKQWVNRQYCSRECSSSSITRVTSIFERLERFQIKNKKGCWGWSGAKDGAGYGMVSNRKQGISAPEKAHRVSYEKENGKISDGLNICHECDNPECTKPDHLFIGTQKENMRDCSNKNRLNKVSLKNLNAGAKGYRCAKHEKNEVKK